MTDDKRKDPFAQIDQRLNGLFGELGRALGEAMTRLEEGGGEVHRSQSFETPNGTMRAEAGIRVRMGGLSAGAAEASDATGAAPSPVNRPANRPPRAAPAAAGPSTADTPPAAPPPRDIAATIVTDATGWTLSAELPGADPAALTLARMGDGLRITAGGAGRDYAGRFDLPDWVDVPQIEVSLRNGVLDLFAPRPEGAAP